MNPHRIPSARNARRRRLIVFAPVALVVSVMVVLAAQQSLLVAFAEVSAEGPSPVALIPPDLGEPVQRDADGTIRDGDQPTVFDTDRAAIAHLDPALLDALQRAAHDAAGDGIRLLVNSGWRSAELQERMRRDAVVQYGSEAEAARWVASAETSAHVTGDAVDLGPLPALDWLAQHGWRYGLCQTYANESWHYELRPDAAANGCPTMYADATEDPRMRP
ncbi:M15 family metallopeptidase [Microbacterium sp. 179-I 3D3 NHS]|uniref:M15 family metallopeptidase n=1 Tax=Microbacterium sp. 179-I 3D3 NHS TaxID=3142382 RepID=UPI0039A33EEA